MRILTIGVILLSLIGCSKNSNAETNTSTDILLSQDENASVDTLLLVESTDIESIPFVILRMNRNDSYITMADSVMPSVSDSAVALCVEAAFTGELLKDFKSTNVAGDYVIDGVLHKGYNCKANTGFLYADKTIYTISSSEHCEEWIGKAQKSGGSLFQQILIVQNGKNVYSGAPITPTTPNIYRAACIMNDGNFAVIQSIKALPLKSFIESLIKLGVSDALYLDMGKGWNYGWYRQTVMDSPIMLFEYRTQYQTNWLLIKAKNGNEKN